MTTATSIVNTAGAECDTPTLLAQLQPALRMLSFRTILRLADGGVQVNLVGKGKLIVKLNAMDLYDVEVGKLQGAHGLDYQVRRQVFGLCADQLTEVVPNLVASAL